MTYTKIQLFIFECLEEDGDTCLAWLIDYFLDYEGLAPFAFGKRPKDYVVPDDLFARLQKEVFQLFDTPSLRLGLYEYKPEGELWEDSHHLLGKEEAYQVMHEKKNWIPRPGGIAYWIAEIDEDELLYHKP